MPKPLWTLAATLILAGCGTPSTSGNGATPAPAPSTPSAFNAANACLTLPREKVAAVTGLKVETAALGPAVQPGEATAGFSTCNYAFGGGGTLTFYARQSPVDDNTPEAIAHTRATIAEGGGKITDIANLGTAAFSAEQMHQLHVFIGANKYIYFMSMDPPPGKPIAEIELALAKTLAG